MINDFSVEELLENGKGEIKVTLNGIEERLASVQDVKIPYQANVTTVSLIDVGDMDVVSGYAKTGTMTCLYNPSIFRELAKILGDTGEVPICSMILSNEGKGNIGTQRLVFEGVRFTQFDIFQSKAGKGTMQENVKFSYTRFRVTNPFSRITH